MIVTDGGVRVSAKPKQYLDESELQLCLAVIRQAHTDVRSPAGCGRAWHQNAKAFVYALQTHDWEAFDAAPHLHGDVITRAAPVRPYVRKGDYDFGGMNGAAFAAAIGINYRTFLDWIKRNIVVVDSARTASREEIRAFLLSANGTAAVAHVTHDAPAWLHAIMHERRERGEYWSLPHAAWRAVYSMKTMRRYAARGLPWAVRVQIGGEWYVVRRREFEAWLSSR